MNRLQIEVFNAIAGRGYANKPTPLFIKDNVLKAVEEWGETVAAMDRRSGPPAYELADVVIPCLCIARICQFNLVELIESELESSLTGPQAEKMTVIRRAVPRITIALGQLAGVVFDGRIPAVDGLAAVCVPIFEIARACKYDLVAEIRGKALKDIPRGIG